MAVLAVSEEALAHPTDRQEAERVVALRSREYEDAGQREAARSIRLLGRRIAQLAADEGGRDLDSWVEEIDAEALDTLRGSLSAEQEAAVVEAGQRSERGRAVSFPSDTRELLRKRWEREAVARFVGVSTWMDFWGGLLGVRS